MKLVKILVCTLVLTGLFSIESNAQNIAEQPCDTQFWRQMSAKAWMEAQREIMQNENLIYKPDSVLEYTCFDQFVAINAYHGGNIFVHTDYFGAQIIPRGTENSLETILTNVVSDSLNAYKANNFSNRFLSDRTAFMSIPANNSDFRDINAGERVSYTCDTMANVWRTSKCSNFIDNSAFQYTDGFYPFDVIAGFDGEEDVDGYSGGIQDVRQWGPACIDTSDGNALADGISFGPSGTWENQIGLASNLGDDLYASKNPLGETYFVTTRMTEAPEGGANCGAPIFTGVQVVINGQQDTFPDGVCLNPGCSYSQNGTCTK